MVCELQTVYNTKNKINAAKIKGSKDVYNWVREIYPVDLRTREAVVTIFLNRQNNTIGFQITSLGGMTGSLIDPKVVFQTALSVGATGIILCHNHPSGNLEPSHSDITITNKIKEGGKFLEIDLLDHLIITNDGYYSFADEGTL